MSLAATLQQNGPRPTTMLPSIKCSTCGNDIAIAAMGDHVCSNGSLTDERPTFGNPLVHGNSDDSSPGKVHEMKTRSRASTLSRKLPRVPLPNINADAANRPYRARTQPGLESSLTPARSDCGSEDPAIMKTPASMAPRFCNSRPPSPEMSANLDCAFPPFSMTDRRPSESQEQRTSPCGFPVPSQSASRRGPMLSAEPDMVRWEPRSPNTQGGENVLQKFNTLQNGPFAARGQSSTGPRGRSDEEAPRRPRAPTCSNGDAGLPPFPHDLHLDGNVDLRSQAQRKAPPPRPARPSSRDVFSPSFLDKLSEEPRDLHTPSTTTRHVGQSGRSHTASSSAAHPGDPTHMSSLSRMRSEPAMRGDFRTPALLYPPQTTSQSGNRTDYRLEDAPPVPRPSLRHRQEASMHAPSDSGSSAASTSCSGSTDGFRPSPWTSPASSVEDFSPLAKAVTRQNDNEHHIPAAGLSVRSQQEPGMRAELPKASSLPRDFAKGTMRAQHQTDPKDCFVPPEPKSPMHPVLANQPLATESYSQRPADHARTPNQILDAPNTRRLQSTSPPQSTAQDSVTSQAPSDFQESRSPRRRMPTSNKAVCRGCNQVIEGKSVKAADGRLTGRWHKACFVCRSCKAPFMTADFYVMHNEPYCEHHYHEKNGSLCHGCNRGIEGQYLETTSTTRHGVVDKLYHPTCFTCVQCRSVLTDSYFEITGQVYCERHALAAMRAQAQPSDGHGMGARSGGLTPHDRRNQLLAERRTTRLINPMTA